jgi:uncharacterized membrane protein
MFETVATLHGKIVGRGIYAVSDDGRTLTITTRAGDRARSRVSFWRFDENTGLVCGAALAAIGVASAVTRTIAVTRVLVGAPAAKMSPLDVEYQRQVTALYGIEEGTERYRAIDRDMQDGSLKYNSLPVVMLLHVVPGALFLLAAPLQLIARVRRHTAVHRSLGYLLLALAIPFAMTGLYIGAREPMFGPVGAIAAVLLGSSFIYAGVRAYVAIRAGDRISHRAWMLRFLALAYAIAVMRALSIIALYAVSSKHARHRGAAVLDRPHRQRARRRMVDSPDGLAADRREDSAALS